MTIVTYHVEVIGSYNQSFGYIWHIFKNLESLNPDTQYIACIEFPNWIKDTFNPGDKGYLTVKYVEQGIDKWFDGENFNFYRYTNTIFMKFMLEKPPINEVEVILD